jgi:NarL family two-component system response regulator LiaR
MEIFQNLYWDCIVALGWHLVAASLPWGLEALEVTHAGNSWIDPSIARIVLNHISQRLTVQAVGVPAPISSRAMVGDEEHNSSFLASSPLTHRELEVLELIVAGCSNLEIASRCYITLDTVKTHVRNILDKLCVDCRTQAATIALRSGLVN